MDDNLPPGVTTNMIPGNRPEDEQFDRLADWLMEETETRGMSPGKLHALLKDALDHHDEAVWIKRALANSPYDISPCLQCYRPVVTLPDGVTLCDRCAEALNGHPGNAQESTR